MAFTRLSPGEKNPPAFSSVRPGLLETLPKSFPERLRSRTRNAGLAPLTVVKMRLVWLLPMVFLWFTYGLPMVYLWFTYGLSMVYLWFTYGLSMVYLWFTYG